jgi:Fe-S oxidoreductase
VRIVDGPRRCCGAPLWRWGDRDGFARHARAFAAALDGVQRLVVDDPGCAYTLATLYPRAGVEVPEVVTTTTLLRAEAWRPRREVKWAVHDDAFALRWLREPSLAELPGIAELSLPPGSVTTGEAGACGGMLASVYDAELAGRVARHCTRDLLGGGARRILVGSPSCRRRLRGAGAPVDDVLEVWHESAM